MPPRAKLRSEFSCVVASFQRLEVPRVYERLLSALERPPAENDVRALRQALAHAERDAWEARQLHLLARKERERIRHEVADARAAWHVEALKAKNKGRVTKEDADRYARTKYPERYRALFNREQDARNVRDALEELAKRFDSRVRVLRLLAGETRLDQRVYVGASREARRTDD